MQTPAFVSELCQLLAIRTATYDMAKLEGHVQIITLHDAPSQIQAQLGPLLDQAEVLVACDDAGLAQALRGSRPAKGAHVCGAAEVTPGVARHVVVLMRRMALDHVLRAVVGARERVTLGICYRSPPKVLRSRRELVERLLEPGGMFIDWDAPQLAHRRKQLCPFLQLENRSVTALSAHLADAAREARGCATAGEYLAFAAQALGWVMTPTATLDNPPLQCIVDGVVPPDLACVAGATAEVIFQRELCFLEPGLAVAFLPDAVALFLHAIPCASNDFLRRWAARQEELSLAAYTEAQWLDVFDEDWGEERHRLARVLGAARPPHLPVHGRLLAACRPAVQWAARLYGDTSRIRLDERAWWVLGAVDNYVARRQPVGASALEALCDADAWATQCAARPGLAQTMQHVQDRVHTLLSQLRPVQVQLQARVRTRHGFGGRADVVCDGDTVVELKLSTQPAAGARFQGEWAIQAAIYAYALKCRRAFLVNLNTGAQIAIEFDANLYH